MKSFVLGNAKSKTSWLAIALIAFGTLSDNFTLVAELIPDKYESKALAIVGVILLILRNLSSQTIEEKGSNQGGFARVQLLAVIAGVLLVALSSCTFLQTRPALSTAGIKVAVVNYLENSSPEKFEYRRQTAKEIATAVMADIDAGDEVSIPGLRAAVAAKLINRPMSQTEMVLLSELLDAIAEELVIQVGKGILKPEDKLVLNRVMKAVIEAADMVTPPAR